MDLGIVATQAVALVSPFLVKGVEEISKSAAKDVWEKIKSVFKRSGNEEMTKALAAAPGDSLTKARAQQVLHTAFAENAELAEEFSSLIAQYNTTNTTTVTGDQNIVFGGNISNSHINLTR